MAVKGLLTYGRWKPVQLVHGSLVQFWFLCYRFACSSNLISKTEALLWNCIICMKLECHWIYAVKQGQTRSNEVKWGQMRSNEVKWLKTYQVIPKIICLIHYHQVMLFAFLLFYISFSVLDHTILFLFKFSWISRSNEVIRLQTLWLKEENQPK